MNNWSTPAPPRDPDQFAIITLVVQVMALLSAKNSRFVPVPKSIVGATVPVRVSVPAVSELVPTLLALFKASVAGTALPPKVTGTASPMRLLTMLFEVAPSTSVPPAMVMLAEFEMLAAAARVRMPLETTVAPV